MATIEYNVSASYIGSALGDSSYVIYAGECGVPANIVQTATKAELLSGITVSVDSSIQSIFLVPVLDNPLTSDCILGCANTWSELVLSEYVVSPTPTVTPTSTLNPSATPSVTPTRTVTPSTSVPDGYTTFDLPQILSKISVDQLQVEINGPVWLRPSVAAAIASYAANGTNVPQSSDQNGNNNVALDRNFRIYTEGESLIVTVSSDFDSRVFWYNDPDPVENKSYVIFDNITLPSSISAPTNETDLKYEEI